MVSDSPLGRVERTFPVDDRSAPQQARSLVGELGGLSDSIRDDLVIVVSELVANAIRHGPPGPGTVQLSIAREADAIRVEVRDPGVPFDPTAAPRSDGGLGLVIVGRIAESWGVIAGGSTIVWCRLAIAPA